MKRERLLSHKETYNIIDFNYISIMDGGGTTCENCGALITNMVTVACSDGKNYIVGTDCAKTLSGINDANLHDANAGIGKLKKFYKKLSDLVKYGHTVRIIHDDDRYTLNTYVDTDFSGKPLERPFLRYQGYSIPANKAHMPIIEKHIYTK